MKKPLLVGAVLVFGVSVSVTLGAERGAAQGPAGAGASDVAHDSSHSSHFLNPLSWARKDPKNSAQTPGRRTEAEKKLTSNLRAQGLLGAKATVTDACAPFTALDECLATLHASHILGVDFVCLRADVTGVHTSSDVYGCKVADGDKAQGLSRAIRQFKPDVNSKQAIKDAEQQTQADLRRIGG